MTAANLLTTEDIYLDPAYQTAVETPEGVGRPVNQSYVCLPDDGLASLGATAMVTRELRLQGDRPELDPYPKSPLKNQPIIYTQALQFPDEAAATAARATLRELDQGVPGHPVREGLLASTPARACKLTKRSTSTAGKAQAGHGGVREARRDQTPSSSTGRAPG